MHRGKDTAQQSISFDEQLTRNLRARKARLSALWRMTANERVAAMRRGELSLEQCAAWAARHPEEVPRVDGEYEYLAAFTPEVCE